MKYLFALFGALAFTGTTWAAESGWKPSAAEMAQALREHTKVAVSPTDIRVGACRDVEEEPTEFECSWRQRTSDGWRRYKAWFAVDGDGWHVIDWPPLAIVAG